MSEAPVSRAPVPLGSEDLRLRDDPLRPTSVPALAWTGIVFILAMLMAVAWVSQIGQEHDPVNDYSKRVCYEYGVGCE
jgi:hypothetical protein